MSSVTTKKLVSDEKEVERYVQFVQSSGHDIIELRYKTIGDEAAHIRMHGWQVAIVGDIDDDAGDLRVVEGVVTFNPALDVPGVWAYIIDTPYNRAIIMDDFSAGNFRVTNKVLEAELKKKAKELGIQTEKQEEQMSMGIKMSPKEKKAIEAVKILEKGKFDLETKLAQMTADVEASKKTEVKTPVEEKTSMNIRTGK